VLDAGGGLWLVVADAPLARYGSAPIERGLRDLDWVSRCALAQEAVVEHFARMGTVIPTKIFTLFTDEGRALAHVHHIRPDVDRLLARVAGREEWSLRVSLDARRALAAARARGGRAGAAVTSGTAFLLLKKAQREAAREIRRAAHADVERVFDDLARHADATRRRAPMHADGSEHLVLDVAFLVPRRHLARFRKCAARAAARLGGRGYDLTLSGPWPPYNFVNEPS
jgi:hypothetical protein